MADKVDEVETVSHAPSSESDLSKRVAELQKQERQQNSGGKQK